MSAAPVSYPEALGTKPLCRLPDSTPKQHTLPWGLFLCSLLNHTDRTLSNGSLLCLFSLPVRIVRILCYFIFVTIQDRISTPPLALSASIMPEVTLAGVLSSAKRRPKILLYCSFEDAEVLMFVPACSCLTKKQQYLRHVLLEVIPFR